ncbi:DUF3710 domain-containing protein [Mariniluteicoccus endophyticus]
MIFGRKKKASDEDVETPEVETTEALDADAADDEKAEPDEAVDTDDTEADEAEGPLPGAGDDTDEEAERWAEFDRSRDWREDGPFDIEEVDLDDDEIERLDFGSLVITPLPECEIRLQVTEDSQQIIAALLVKDESAIELSAYAAPRTPGMWAEIRDEIIEGTQAAGGTADCVEGPFGTELVRNLPVQTPEGQLAFQPSRTWVAEGPRWLLRGVLFGQAAMTDEHDDDLVGPFYDAFCDVVVRRGDTPMPVGDVLALTLPPELQAAQQQADAEQAQA